MKTWLHFYIEHTVKNGKPFRKETGWALILNIKRKVPNLKLKAEQVGNTAIEAVVKYFIEKKLGSNF